MPLSAASQTNPLERTNSPSTATAQGSALASSTALSATALGSATASGASALGLTALGATALQGTMQEPYQPNLSKHERQLMQQAHERHQASITSKQVCQQHRRQTFAIYLAPTCSICQVYSIVCHVCCMPAAMAKHQCLSRQCQWSSKLRLVHVLQASKAVCKQQAAAACDWSVSLLSFEALSLHMSLQWCIVLHQALAFTTLQLILYLQLRMCCAERETNA